MFSCSKILTQKYNLKQTKYEIVFTHKLNVFFVNLIVAHTVWKFPNKLK